ADLLVPVVEGQDPGGHVGRVLTVFAEGGQEDQVLPGRDVFGRVDLLLHHADEVVDVVQPVVLDVQGMPAEARPVREQHTLCAGGGNVHQRPDRVGAVADVHRLRLGHLGGAGEVDVAVAGRGQLRPRCGDDLHRGPVVEREGAVVAGLGEPQVHQLPQLVRVLGGEVVYLGAVRSEE